MNLSTTIQTTQDIMRRDDGVDGDAQRIGQLWQRLENFFAIVTDGDHQPPPKTETGVPFVVIGNLNAGQISFNADRFVSEPYYESLDWSRKPTKGNILYTVTGSFGIPILVDTLN